MSSLKEAVTVLVQVVIDSNIYDGGKSWHGKS